MKVTLLSSVIFALSAREIFSLSSTETAEIKDAFKTTAFYEGRGEGGHTSNLRGRRISEVDSDVDETPASAFGTELFSEVSSSSPGDNVLLSPLSVSNALLMVRDGATPESETKGELDKVLGNPPSLVYAANCNVIMNTASSIWADSLKESYISEMEDRYGAASFPLPSTYAPVNDWIETETRGLIKDFMPADERPSGPTLVNTVYFKAAWRKNTFDPEHTIDGDFTLREGSTKKARFMKDVNYMDAIVDAPGLGGASAVILPYDNHCSDGGFTSEEWVAMFILPADSSANSMDDAVAGLDSHTLADLLDETTGEYVNLELPRFKVEYGPKSLTSSLQQMGMKAAFDPSISNKFDKMTHDPSLTVRDVLHGAVLSVTEEGTEAGAVTVIPMYGSSGHESLPVEMKFNRPFVVAIIHLSEGTPIFIGKVEDPEMILEDPVTSVW